MRRLQRILGLLFLIVVGTGAAQAQTVQNVSTPANGYYATGDVLAFVVHFDAAVTISGAPQLLLRIGASSPAANYIGGSGPTTDLIFSYAVQAGDEDFDGISVDALSIAGGSIVSESSGFPISDLSLRNVGSTTGVFVHTAVPSVSISMGASSVVSGPFTLTVTFSEAVTGLSVADLNVLNTTVSNLQTSDNITYTMLLTPASPGTRPVSLPANVVVNIAGTPNTASNQLIYTYTLVPIVANSTATVPANAATMIAPSLSGPSASTLDVVTGPAHGSVSTSGLTFIYSPQAGYSGSDSFVYTATGAGGTSSSATIDITVTPPTIVLAPADGALPPGEVGTPWPTVALVASDGMAPYGFALAGGALPPGITLSSAGELSGNPTAAGNYSFTVEATDNNGATGSAAYTMVIEAQSPGSIVLTPADGALPPGEVGTPWPTVALAASDGTAPYSFALAGGALPPGITLSSAGELSGNPTAAGSYSFTVEATDDNGVTGSAAYTIVIEAQNPGSIVLTPADGALPPGEVGTPWPTVALAASDGTAPYSFALAGGALPPGITLSPAGELSGNPTAAGSYSFTVEVTDDNGVTGSAAYTIVIEPAPSPRPGSIVIRQEVAGDDAVFGFTSPEPALNLSIATASGSGQSPAISLPAGTYRIAADDMTGAGYTPTGLICSDDDSTTDPAARVADIVLAAGETVTCTFSASNAAEATTRLIEQFLDNRAALIVSNLPDAGRRIGRLNGVMTGIGNPASALMGYVSRLESGSLNVSTSLAAIDAMTGMEKQSRFDAWLSGTFARLDAGNGEGRFGTVAIGADYLIDPNLLVGGFLQFDTMQQDIDSGAHAAGSGWLAGPYLTARLNDNLYLDLLAATGRSSNSVSPFGSYEDDFDSTRYLLSAALEGQLQWGNWTFSPRTQLSYFREDSESYTDDLGTPIPTVTIIKGEASAGPGISYRFVTDGMVTVDVGGRLDGVADMTEGISLDHIHGRVQGTLDMSFSGGASVGLAIGYDGIGTDTHTTSGRLSLSIPVN